MSKTFGVHPGIFKFIDCLKSEQATHQVTMAQIDAGAEPTARKLKYVREDKRLMRLVKKFDSEIQDGNYMTYIESIAHNTRF